ncbi:MAG: signal peptide peptidase SppA [Cyclobacteriaceae bacterium]|jgi:protease-4|nr:signal peptide peptidase SppA [Cyclobacteriaceae bacterium]
MNFWKTFLAAFLAFVVFSFVSFFLMFTIIGALSAEETVTVSKNSVLHLKLDAEFTEQQVDNPFEGLPIPGADVQTVGLLKLKESLTHAKTDPSIEGIYLNISMPLAGFAVLEEVRNSLIDFRAEGKWIVAYADVMSEQAYYVASAADKVYLNPEGEVELNGLNVEITFFKRLFDKLEIKPEIFRVGDYKSAVEPFLLDKMSAENRTQLTELINSIYDYVLQGIGESRNLEKARLREISDKMLVKNAGDAVEYGLVDSLLYYDGVLSELRNRLGLGETEKINFIRLNRYSKSMKPRKYSKNEIAVIVAEGTILPGTGTEGVVGGDAFAEEIRKARLSNKVKAIVIRINSPGGAFQASDAMWREVTLAAKEKPVIASMSGVAASGGYYLAMACDTIVAQPHTITGSIGVFTTLFDASAFLGNKLGITFDEVRTGEYGSMLGFTRPLSDAERRVWQRRTEDIYETFTSKAAAGRDMPVEDLKKVASGRVWSGIQAKERGLVDILGGYNDAIRIAADAAVLEDYSVKLYPRRKPFIEQLLGQLSENARVSTLKKELGADYVLYQQWQQVRQMNGIQARMPFELMIR